MNLRQYYTDSIKVGLMLGERPEVIAMHLGYSVDDLVRWCRMAGEPGHAAMLIRACEEAREAAT